MRLGEILRQVSPALVPPWFGLRCADSACVRGGGWAGRRSRGLKMEGDWYCSGECLEAAVRQRLSRLQPWTPLPRSYRVPLGLLLVARGQISYQQVRQGLEAQRRAGRGRLGEWMQELGLAREEEVTAALAAQWGCPVFPLAGNRIPECASLLPLALMERYGVLPVHYAAGRRDLYLGCAERREHSLFYAVERMLGCRTHAAVVGGKAMKEILERLHQVARPRELVFGNVRDPAERARITRSYAQRVGAEEVALTQAAELVWVRLSSAQGPTDLLFGSEGVRG